MIHPQFPSCRSCSGVLVQNGALVLSVCRVGWHTERRLLPESIEARTSPEPKGAGTSTLMFLIRLQRLCFALQGRRRC